MKVLVVSEGPHELGDNDTKGALIVLTSRLLDEDVTFDREKVSSPRVRVHRQPGRGRGSEKRALAWIRFAEREGYDAIILVIDQDEDTDRKQEFERAQQHTLFLLPRALGVAIRSFDAWMLADEQALSHVLEMNIDLPPNPEAERDPKGRCEELRKNANAQLSPREMYSEIAKRTDTAKLEARCPNGFAPFAGRVRALNSL